MEMRYRSMPCELVVREAATEQPPIIEGYFAVFDSEYRFAPDMYETIDPHAFDETLGDDIRALINHDTTLVLGRTKSGTLKLHVDEHGLFGRIEINRNDSDAMNLYARVQRKDVSQCSIGFVPLAEETEILKDETGRDVVHFIEKRVSLLEVTCCTFPAYEATDISARTKQGQDILRKQAEAWRIRNLEKLNKWRNQKC